MSGGCGSSSYIYMATGVYYPHDYFIALNISCYCSLNQLVEIKHVNHLTSQFRLLLICSSLDQSGVLPFHMYVYPGRLAYLP